MKQHFEEYLESLPLTKVVKGRIEEVIIMTTKIHDFDFKDIFVCELKNNEGRIDYNSLWLFGEEYIVECKNFMNEIDIDLTPIYKKITYSSVYATNYDFENLNDSSFIKIDFTLMRSHVTGILTAIGNNCVNVQNIYKKYIIPNFIE